MNILGRQIKSTASASLEPSTQDGFTVSNFRPGAVVVHQGKPHIVAMVALLIGKKRLHHLSGALTVQEAETEGVRLFLHPLALVNEAEVQANRPETRVLMRPRRQTWVRATCGECIFLWQFGQSATAFRSVSSPPFASCLM